MYEAGGTSFIFNAIFVYYSLTTSLAFWHTLNKKWYRIGIVPVGTYRLKDCKKNILKHRCTGGSLNPSILCLFIGQWIKLSSPVNMAISNDHCITTVNITFVFWSVNSIITHGKHGDREWSYTQTHWNIPQFLNFPI